MKTKEKVINFLNQNEISSVDNIALKLKVSRQYIHKIMIELLQEHKVTKTGKAPHVYYSILEIKKSKREPIAFEKEYFLNEHFIQIDALGKLYRGFEAMVYWCENQQLPLHKTVEEYIETRKKYLSFLNQQYLINGLQKLKNTNGLGTIGTDELYYLDFYAIERFGKTRLGTLMHYAKQGQNKKLMTNIVDEIKNRLLHFISTEKIEAILFVPPTIKRKVQIMHFLEKNLNIDLPLIKVKKISNEIVIPQKALSKLFERVANAKSTFLIPEQKKYNKVLIIDDAIGSGATINEIALKLKNKKIAKYIIGIAITGSYKGFEVISEI